jgi:hypothetical protein
VDTAERWGDYTGIARKYNEPGLCWLNGSWGDNTGLTRTWIAKVRNADPKLGMNENPATPMMPSEQLYPNPASNDIRLSLHLTQTEWLSFYIVNVDGSTSRLIYRDTGKPGESIFTLPTDDLASGTYILKIIGNKGTATSYKFIVQH